MALNNLAYRQEAFEESYDAQPIPLPRPQLRTIEGQGKGTRAQSQQAPWVLPLIIMSALVVVVLASVSIARVSIANATVQMMQTAGQMNLAINQARAVGLELEVQHSLANSPTRIQDRAATLGILPANQPATIEARNDFSVSTKNQMHNAALESREASLALLLTKKAHEPASKPALTDVEGEPVDNVEPEAGAESPDDQTVQSPAEVS